MPPDPKPFGWQEQARLDNLKPPPMPDSEKVKASEVLAEAMDAYLRDAITAEHWNDDPYERAVAALLAHAPSDSEGVVITREGVLGALPTLSEVEAARLANLRAAWIEARPIYVGDKAVDDIFELFAIIDRLRPTGLSESEPGSEPPGGGEQ